jgi:endonuclease/exonuclease/phosphatase family metal-dependent hydrolase
MPSEWWGALVCVLAGCSQAPRAEPPGASAPEGAAIPPATDETGAATVPLKLATWNLEWLSRTSGTGTVKRTDADYERLEKYAARLNADIVAVQEVDGEEALRCVFDDAVYDYHVASQTGVQLTGFVYRSTLTVTKNPDLAELDVGGVRNGTDLTVTVDGHSLRLLSVHLESGCFDQPLTTPGNDCTKLSAQLPVLESWIDARAGAGEPFVVLGDLIRRMKAGEAFYTEIDDGQPPNADLTLATHVRRRAGTASTRSSSTTSCSQRTRRPG